MPFPTTGYNANPWDFNQPVRTAQPSQMQNTFVWAQGEQAAKSYPVAPGNRVLIFDSENPVFYIKMADQTGRPLPLEIYDFKKREATEVIPAMTVTYPDFATKDDVRTIIKEELESFRNTQFKPRNKEEKK